MTIDQVFKIAAIGVVICIVNQLLTRAGREEIATMATLAGLIVVMTMVVGMIQELMETVRALFELG